MTSISFSLLNKKEFSIKAESPVHNVNILLMLEKIPEGRFDWQSLKWVFPIHLHERLGVALTRSGCVVKSIPKKLIIAIQLNEKVSKSSLDDLCPKSVLDQLASFQKDGVEFVLARNGRAIIADEMGLGKTRSALACAAVYRTDWPLLIITPSSARYHWLAETKSILGAELLGAESDVTLVESAQDSARIRQLFSQSQFKTAASSSSTSSSPPTSISPAPKVIIISFGLIAAAREDLLNGMKPSVVIVDECHYMKNRFAKRTQAIIPLLQKAKRSILLSGTPALSRPLDLFTQLHSLDPETFSNEKEFANRYCLNNTKKRKNFSSQYQGGSNSQELHIVLTNTLMIRRLKKDILSKLPKKVRELIEIEIFDEAQRDTLKVILAEIKARQLAKKGRGVTSKRRFTSNVNELGQPGQAVEAEIAEDKRTKNCLFELYQKSGCAKLEGVIKEMEKFLNDTTSGKLLVFAHHRQVLDGLSTYLLNRNIEFIRIDGSVSSKERYARTEHFQHYSSCRVAVLAITAAGMAITLTAASTVYFAEMYWNPGSILQAEDRAHRIGQLSTVKVTYFIARGSVDDLLLPLLKAKLKVLGQVIEGGKDRSSDFFGADRVQSMSGLKCSVSSGVLCDDDKHGVIDLTFSDDEDISEPNASDNNVPCNETTFFEPPIEALKFLSDGRSIEEDADKMQGSDDDGDSLDEIDDDASDSSSVQIALPDPLALWYIGRSKRACSQDVVDEVIEKSKISSSQSNPLTTKEESSWCQGFTQPALPPSSFQQQTPALVSSPSPALLLPPFNQLNKSSVTCNQLSKSLGDVRTSQSRILPYSDGINFSSELVSSNQNALVPLNPEGSIPTSSHSEIIKQGPQHQKQVDQPIQSKEINNVKFQWIQRQQQQMIYQHQQRLQLANQGQSLGDCDKYINPSSSSQCSDTSNAALLIHNFIAPPPYNPSQADQGHDSTGRTIPKSSILLSNQIADNLQEIAMPTSTTSPASNSIQYGNLHATAIPNLKPPQSSPSEHTTQLAVSAPFSLQGASSLMSKQEVFAAIPAKSELTPLSRTTNVSSLYSVTHNSRSQTNIATTKASVLGTTANSTVAAATINMTQMLSENNIGCTNFFNGVVAKENSAESSNSYAIGPIIDSFKGPVLTAAAVQNNFIIDVDAAD